MFLDILLYRTKQALLIIYIMNKYLKGDSIDLPQKENIHNYNFWVRKRLGEKRYKYR